MSDIRDGDWRLMSYDHDTGVRSWMLDLGDGRIVVKTETPVDELLDHNKEQFNASQGQRFGDGKIVASIPLDIYHASGLATAVHESDHKFVSRFLNDSDHSRFRTFRGRI